MSESDEKTCPFCAETIKAAAIICKFCQRDLRTGTTEPLTPFEKRFRENFKGCLWILLILSLPFIFFAFYCVYYSIGHPPETIEQIQQRYGIR